MSHFGSLLGIHYGTINNHIGLHLVFHVERRLVRENRVERRDRERDFHNTETWLFDRLLGYSHQHFS